MKKITLVFGMLVLTAVAFAQQSFYDFKVKDIEGKDFYFSSLKGKKVLIVNTASLCGNTPQYAQLQELYLKYGDKNFVIIGFPANNFGAQEPGTNKEIAEYCTSKYSVTFPMMSKISVKGDDMNEVYQWLTMKSKNGVLDSEVTWNFQKYLIDEKGNLVKTVSPKVKPNDMQIESWIMQ